MNTSHLGSYILQEVPDAGKYIEQALAIQTSLFERGERRNIGQIMTENGWISKEKLQHCLVRQLEDRLVEIELFETIPFDVLMRLARESRQISVPPGNVIFNYGDKNDSYFIIVSGRVVISDHGEDGRDETIESLGPGDCFGEMALLSGNGSGTKFTAEEPTVLILIPKPAFDFILATGSAVSQEFIRILAGRLMKSANWISQVKADEEAYRQFIAEQLGKHEPSIIGSSKVIKKVLADIDLVSEGSGPVLVQGESGTELWDAAALIHRKSRESEKLVTYDAMWKGTGYRSRTYERRRQSDMLSQMSTLFGRANSMQAEKGGRIGLLQIADGGTLVVEHVEMLHPKVQQQLAELVATSTFQSLFDNTTQSSSVRLIFTTSADLANLAEHGKFDIKLLDLISQNIITLPQLRKRKKDLREIVAHLIERNNRQLGMAIEGLDDNAYKEIMASDWPGNIEELNNAIRRAMMLCRDRVLSAEHIFVSSPPVTGQITFDLFKISAVKDFFLKSGFLTTAPFVLLPFIAIIIVTGLFGSQDPAKSAAIVLTWGYWEPIFVLSLFFFSRLWCTFCPIGSPVYFISRRIGLKKKVPQLLRNYGIYLSAAGIAAIFWAQSVSHMYVSPRATGLLMLTVLLLALFTGMVFERRTWCRYLCPLGAIAGFLSRCSVIELRSNYHICNEDCMKHDCYVGNDKAAGCPLLQGPFSLRTNKDCILCGSCIRACPNNSLALNLRIPGQELWASHQIEKSAVIICSTMLGTQLFRGLEHAGAFGTLASSGMWWLWAATSILSLTLGVIVASAVIGKLVFPVSDKSGRITSRIIYSFIPLSFSFEIGDHLGRMLTLGGLLPDVILYYIFGKDNYAIRPVVTAGGIKTLQVIIMLIGLAGSVYVAKRMSGGINSPARFPKWPAFVLCIILTSLFVAFK
jgi:polyferredoxin/CRP-like cAMP-binding protein